MIFSDKLVLIFSSDKKHFLESAFFYFALVFTEKNSYSKRKKLCGEDLL